VEGAACWVTTEPCLDCTKQLIQALLGEVYYWRPYPSPNPESDALRAEMRRHARRETKFTMWSPDSNVLDLEARYSAIKRRLDDYVAMPK